MSSEKRYKILPHSESAHCCFECTVIDSLEEDPMNTTVCETFSEEDAKLVCDALNLKEDLKMKKDLNQLFSEYID